MKKISAAKRDKELANEIKERYNYVCQVCLNYSKMANVHHILPKNGYPDLRYDIKNLIVLCPRCHRLSRTAAHQNSIFFCLWLLNNEPERLMYLIDKLKPDFRKYNFSNEQRILKGGIK